MAEEYHAAQERAHRQMLRTIQETDREIAEIYGRAADALASSAGKQKSGGLTERWQKDMSESLAEQMRQLRGEVNGAVTGAAGSASRLPGATAADWLASVLERATGSKNGGDAFRSVLTRTSDEAMRAVVTGQAYLDGKKLSSRIWSSAGRLQGGINDVLRQGIAQKRSAYQIAKDLEAYVNPIAREPTEWSKAYPDIPFPGRADYSARRLARTSINHAYHIAMKEAAAANPFVTCIHWALSPQHFERQILPFGADICDEYADHDEGLGRGNWPVQSVPLPHAQCLCTQYAVVPDSMDTCAARLKRWLDGGDDPQLEGGFAEWKRELAGETIDRGVRHDGAERRTALIEAAAKARGVEGMGPSRRERLFEELDNLSIEALEWIIDPDKTK